jgi:RNA polymerase sigma-70 factor (ECF subfamily)
MSEGVNQGLAIIDELAAMGELENYHLLHAAKADLLRRQGALEAASKSYLRALELVANDRERRYLERRLAQVSYG